MLDPWSGTKIPHAQEQGSLLTATTEPTHSGARALQPEKPVCHNKDTVQPKKLQKNNTLTMRQCIDMTLISHALRSLEISPAAPVY